MEFGKEGTAGVNFHLSLWKPDFRMPDNVTYEKQFEEHVPSDCAFSASADPGCFPSLTLAFLPSLLLMSNPSPTRAK